MSKSNADELRCQVRTLLEKHQPLKHSNITSAERKALKDLKQVKSITILPADKRKCVVVLNTQDYKRKCLELLSDNKTNVKLKKDPTKEYTTKTPPRFYGLPKVLKEGTPL